MKNYSQYSKYFNFQGAFFGSISGLVIMAWLTVKTQASIATGDILFPQKPVTTSGCNYQFKPKLSPGLNLHLSPALNTTDIVHPE